MEIEKIKEEAANLQEKIADLKHYDTVQNAMLLRAQELKLTWPETKQFSSEVHRLKFGEKKMPAPAEEKTDH